MTQHQARLPETPSQTAGPYVHLGCLPTYSGIEGVYAEDLGSRMVDANTQGERITIRGLIYDGDGTPLTDAVIEAWQADAGGLYASPEDSRGETNAGFGGWGRQACDAQNGEYRFATLKPGPVPYPDGRSQAPHITLWIIARGINVGLHTRLYFDDESDANAADPVLEQIEPRERRETLLATTDGAGGYRFDIYLQGPRETVFLDI